MLDYLIIGAGPAGLACAIEAEKKQLNYLVVEKGCIVNSIYNFPADMEFFSTPNLMEIGELVFVTESFRPTRIQTLNYYLAVVKHYGLKIAQNHEVIAVEKTSTSFKLTTKHHGKAEKSFEAKKVIIATGYFDNPNYLGIDGEELGKVSHYYTEAHPCYDLDVAIIGGKNSAVEAAMSFARAGARVTLIHRGSELSSSVKYWIKPDIEKLIENGKVKALFNSQVTKITNDEIFINNGKDEIALKNDKLYALTGYHPDTELLKSFGVEFDEETLTPITNPNNLESNVAGLYLAGSIVAGMNCNKIFIENSREHGKLILS